MATVPLRTGLEQIRYEQSWTRPRQARLVLVQDQEISDKQTRPRARRSARYRWEDRLFVLATAAVLLFCLINAVNLLYRSAASTYRSPLSVTASIPVTVHPGDSLWTYAQKYGAPDVYILDRVDGIARANHLTADTPLIPGQHLVVPVTNLAILARMERGQLLARN